MLNDIKKNRVLDVEKFARKREWIEQWNNTPIRIQNTSIKLQMDRRLITDWKSPRELLWLCEMHAASRKRDAFSDIRGVEETRHNRSMRNDIDEELHGASRFEDRAENLGENSLKLPHLLRLRRLYIDRIKNKNRRILNLSTKLIMHLIVL